MMKELRRVLVCLILALLCRYPSRHVCCLDESSTGPAQLAQDSSAQATQEKKTDRKDEEKWSLNIQSSYDYGLEAEKAFQDEILREDCGKEKEHDQTVKTDEPSGLAEPEPVSEAVPEHGTSLSLDDTPSTASATTENISSTPTSQTPPVTQSSAIEVPSADTHVGSSYDAEQSAADCEAGGTPVASPPSESPPFDRSLDSLAVEHIENISSTHGRGKGTKTDLDSPLTPVGKDKPELDQSGGNTSHVQKGEKVDPNNIKDPDPSAVVNGKDPGDIPTFDEWKKKVMEVEKEKSQSMHPSSNGSPHTVKKVQKNFNNYASVECGAKILSANPEAKSTSAILMENMDLYMLNPCSNKIWFVIELCEPIQVKQLDIANFELFSSTPKDFLVSISDRYPTNKWIKLGTFHARDERTVQSFPLDEQLYAKYVKMFIKYIKVELLSHFGSEHFCPLSLIRVFGTSMVEEYEEIAESQYASERLEYLDEDYDYPPGYVPPEDKSSKNLLGSATNAILNMVNIAANMLGAKPELDDAARRDANISTEAMNQTETSSVPQPTTDSPPMLETREVGDPSLAPVEEPEPALATEPLVPEESLIVQLVHEEEEEPSPSTVTLLEDEDLEDEEAEGQSKHQLESNIYCGELPFLSCVASFSEYIFHWCTAITALQRQHSSALGKQEAEPDHLNSLEHSTLMPIKTLDLPVIEEPIQTELPLVKEDVSTSATDINQESRHPETIVELTELEPSQSSNLPQQSFSDEASIKVTPTEKIPEPSTEDLSEKGMMHPDRTLETQAEGKKKTPASTSFSSSSSTLEEPVPGSESEALRKEDLISTVKDHHTETVQAIAKPTETQPALELPALSAETETGAVKAIPEEPTKPAASLEPGDSPGSVLQELKGEESVEDIILTVPSANGQLHRTATDFYAELQNSSDLGYSNGNQVHGSNQKESVFMRLNNRIKALEMNMSLSSRYLEELSQRYRKQMEEMQRAFNKTIIQLQNTSRIAEEQDQRQTESIQLLQGQLENVTELVLNLSATVSQLQREVSDWQNYLVISLVLCLSLGLLLCVQRYRNSAPLQKRPDSSIPKSNHYPSPKRCFSSYDDMSLKRRISCPLVRSKSFQLPTTEGPDDLYIVEPLRFSPENKKKKRCKMKNEKIETLKSSVLVPPVANGGPKCNGPVQPHSTFLPSGEVCTSSYKGPPSEGSSEGSSHSDESYFCGISACTRLCNGQPPPKTKTEKRAFKRRRSKMTEQGKCVGDLLQTRTGAIASLQDIIIKGNKEMTVGTFGVTAVSGQV
ncbi:SUN domain-containing ossification factor isoform X2 [Lepisosteus oculatus]|uniref:SUN domain-containing ossification factor isoform X2 n=1 Tax=Lepisosteus oculatus TaxID=7918 RepID=UPI00372296AD